MELSTDVKIGIGIIAATVLIIGGAAWYSGKQAPAQIGAPVTQPELLTRENNPLIGDINASVQVVEFADFECPACAALHPVMMQVQTRYADDSVAFIFRHFPLPQHNQALLAAEASEAAHNQGKFWEYADLLFQNQPRFSREQLETYAEELELDMEEFRSVLDNRTYRSLVQSDLRDARALGVNSTPTLFINGVRYTGPYSVNALAEAIENARQ